MRWSQQPTTLPVLCGRLFSAVAQLGSLEFRLTISKIEAIISTMTKPRKVSQNQLNRRKLVGDIVRRFIPARAPLLAETEWKKESVACSKLISQYSHEFLLTMSPPPFKINSLYFFLTSSGRKYINEEKTRIQVMQSVSGRNSSIENNTPKFIQIPLNLEPEQHTIVKKPKNKLEFLND